MVTLKELQDQGEAPTWLEDAGYSTLTKGYLLDNETPKGMYERISHASATRLGHPEYFSKFFELFWKNWLCPATPVCTNMGTTRGLPISCFSLHVGDSVQDIMGSTTEVALLAKHGGGVGTYWGDVRPRGSRIGENGTSEGIVPFLKILDSTTVGISQGSTRRGASVAYLPIEHGDFDEFINIRRPQGDVNRQCMNINHAVTISDDFMHQVIGGQPEARRKWKEVLKSRFETGEPYIMFKDTINRDRPECYKGNNLDVTTSNLCLTGDTYVMTKQGHFPIKDLVGKTVDIYNGLEWESVSNFRQTNEKADLVEVTLRDGSTIRCTPYHRFVLASGEMVEAKDLKPKQKLKRHEQEIQGTKDVLGAYVKGFLVGDGTNVKGRPLLFVYDTKYQCLDRLISSVEELPIESNHTTSISDVSVIDDAHNRKRITGLSVRKDALHVWATEYKTRLPDDVYNWSLQAKVEFIAGVMDADGTFNRGKEGEFVYQIASIHKEWLFDFVHLLKTIGVFGRIGLMRKAGKTNFNDGYRAYETKDCWRLTITNVSARHLAKQVSFTRLGTPDPVKEVYNCKPTFAEVHSVTALDTQEPVYCCTVPSTNQFALTCGIMSGNCSEITLHTDEDHTFVCCLSSMNLARWDEWKDTDAVYWAIHFLDGVMTEFIARAKNIPGFERAVRFSEKSRALGLGVLGWHSYLQNRMVAMDSMEAYLENRIIFKHMRQESYRASGDLAKEYGEPEWCRGYGMRNTHTCALAPTASNSVISGNVSPGIEPLAANAYAHKTAKGTFLQKNRKLMEVLETHKQNTDEVWKSIVQNEGSVQHLDFLDENEKAVFLTAREINQFVLVKLAAARQPFIDQTQSVNLFFPANTDPGYFNQVHLEAWRSGMHTLYYTRTTSVLKGDAGASYKRDAGECSMCEG